MLVSSLLIANGKDITQISFMMGMYCLTNGASEGGIQAGFRHDRI